MLVETQHFELTLSLEQLHRPSVVLLTNHFNKLKL